MTNWNNLKELKIMRINMSYANEEYNVCFKDKNGVSHYLKVVKVYRGLYNRTYAYCKVDANGHIYVEELKNDKEFFSSSMRAIEEFYEMVEAFE